MLKTPHCTRSASCGLFDGQPESAKQYSPAHLTRSRTTFQERKYWTHATDVLPGFQLDNYIWKREGQLEEKLDYTRTSPHQRKLKVVYLEATQASEPAHEILTPTSACNYIYLTNAGVGYKHLRNSRCSLTVKKKKKHAHGLYRCMIQGSCIYVSVLVRDLSD